jgi:hypothetical protein
MTVLTNNKNLMTSQGNSKFALQFFQAAIRRRTVAKIVKPEPIIRTM